jgi:4-hydroxy-tetrahydrodipicolinate synthase
MKSTNKFHGVVIPMVTPFTGEGKIDVSAAIRLTDHVINAGTFPFLLGTTGESASISTELCLSYVEQIADHALGKTTIYSGISATCLQDSLDLAHKFRDYGVDVLVAHLPQYYPLTTDQMLKYYEILADKTPLPIMIYNIPSTTHMSIPIDVLEKLSHHPNIAGLKDSERDLERIDTLASVFKDKTDFCLLSGWTTESTYTLRCGFDGIVPSTGNLVPKLFKELYDAIKEGDENKTDDLQAVINPIADVHQKNLILSTSISTLKVMMKELDLCDSFVLPPLVKLSVSEEQDIIKKMRKLAYFSN